jgi:hypothetical protein
MQILEVHFFEKKPIIQLVRGATKQIPELLVYNQLNLLVNHMPLKACLTLIILSPIYYLGRGGKVFLSSGIGGQGPEHSAPIHLPA